MKVSNILIVHNYYQVPGGEDTVVANEKKLLEEHGHKVILYSRNNSELKEMSKFQKLLLPITTVFNCRTYREIKRIIKENNIDIVHVHNTLNLISPAVYYAANRCKKPVVQTIHNFRLLCPGATFYRNGAICEDCVNKGLMCAVKHSCYRGSRLQTLACVVSTAVHRMTGIYKKINYICLTEFNKKKLLNLPGVKENQIFVKPNFSAVEKKQCIPFEKRENQFVFAGRLDELKGIDTLLEAWKWLGSSSPRLVICGTGPKEQECRQYIQDNQLMNVEMLGFVDNRRVKEIIAKSKALILPTKWYEGFPMSIVEAFSLGTPVITSDLGNAGSLIEQDVNGRKFPVGDAKQLAEAVVNFPNLEKQTFSVYHRNYEKENNYNLLIEVYDKVGKISAGKK